MADFNTYYPKLLKYEGGYASEAYAKSQNDSGGETYMGIARNYNKDWAGWKIIDDYKKKIDGLPKYNSFIKDPKLDALAKQQSKKIYWDKLKLDNIKNQSLAEYIMDFGFNSGLATPVKAITGLLNLPIKTVMTDDLIAKINSVDPGKLFKDLQEYRIKFVSNISHLTQKMRDGLVKRAKSFVYDNKGTIAVAVGVGFFFWIVVGLIVLVIVYKNRKK